MKLNYILCLMLGGLLRLSGQNYFDLRLDQDQIGYCISTLPLDHLLIAGTQGDLAAQNLDGWAKVVTASGTAVSDFQFHQAGKNIRFRKVILTANSVAHFATEITDLTTFRTRAALVSVSFNQPASPAYLQMVYYGDSTDNLEIQGVVFQPSNNQILIYGTDKSTTDGVILIPGQTIRLGGPGQQSVNSLTPFPGGGWSALVTEWDSLSLSSMLILDAGFQVITSFPLPNDIYAPLDLSWRNDTTWYCTGARRYCLDAPSGLRPRDIVLVQGHRDSGVVQTTCLGTVNENDLPGGMAFQSDKNELILSWTPAYRIFVPQSQGYGRNQIPISKTDTTGLVLNQAKVGETAYYEIHQVTTPSYGSDGKTTCIVGSRYDIWNPQTGTDVFWVTIPPGIPLKDQENQTQDTGFALYPNPARSGGHITLKHSKIEANGKFRFIRADGALIFSGVMQESGFQAPELPAGLYWLQAETRDGWMTAKLILE